MGVLIFAAWKNVMIMETQKNYAALIAEVAETLYEKELKNLDSLQCRINEINDYLGLTTGQTLLFIPVFDQQCKNATADIRDIAGFYSVSRLNISARKKDLDVLIEKRYIADSEPKMLPKHMGDIQFKVNDCIFKAILNQEEIRVPEAEVMRYNQFDFVHAINEAVRDSTNKSKQIFECAIDLERRYNSFPLVRRAMELCPDKKDRIILYLACNEYLEGASHRGTELDELLDDIFENISDRVNYKESVYREESALIRNGLVSFWCDNDSQYYLELTDYAIRLLLQNQAVIFGLEDRELTRFEFVKQVQKLIMSRERKEMETSFLKMKFVDLESRNARTELVKTVRGKIEKPIDRLLFYYSCYSLVFSKIDIDDLVDDIVKRPEERMLLKNELLSGTHELVKNKLIEFEEADFFGSCEVSLTEDGKDLFFGSETKYFESVSTKDCRLPDSIQAKNLFFEPNLEKQMRLLEDSFQQENFKALQNRLAEQALPTGVAALFYGAPGTGKTESVYQLARSTDRAIVQVDIANMKTCWYGESQKLVRKVFAKYRNLCKKSRHTPILLFNEADAIFSCRCERVDSSVDQTENAIQNIILEEMEKLEGILIATTNLAANLDPAFERRFLFKVKFDRPSIKAKESIWRDKIPSLSSEQAAELAASYEFSGGEIDNIVRKLTMNSIIYGGSPNLEQINDLCSKERLHDEIKQRKIGY